MLPRPMNRIDRVEYQKNLRLDRGLIRALEELEPRPEPGSGEPGLTNEEMEEVLNAAWQLKEAGGAFLVFGYDTLEYAIRLAGMLGRGAELHVYDSFAGAPPMGPKDYEGGYFSRDGEDPLCVRPEPAPQPRAYGPSVQSYPPSIEVEAFWASMVAAGAKPAVTHEGDFAGQSYPYPVAFSLIDAGLYQSTLDAVTESVGRLSPGGLLMVRMLEDEVGVEAALAEADLGDMGSFIVTGFVVFQKEMDE